MILIQRLEPLIWMVTVHSLAGETAMIWMHLKTWMTWMVMDFQPVQVTAMISLPV